MDIQQKTPDGSVKRKGARRRPLPDENNLQRAFIAAYQLTGSVRSAAADVKIDRSIFFRWFDKDSGFRTAFEEAQTKAGYELESEAVRRATEGVQRKIYFRGKPIKTRRSRSARAVTEVEYSDGLLALLLKRFLPDKYRERSDVNVSGSITLAERLKEARLQVMKTPDEGVA